MLVTMRNGVLERTWDEVIMVYFELLSRRLPEETEKKYEKPDSE